MAATLGEMSLRDFEGDSSDPFEAASLQAINDMELLQTVLIQHTPHPPLQPQPRGDTVAMATAPQPLPSSQPALGGASQQQQLNLGQSNVTHPQSNAMTAQPPLYGGLPLVLPPVRHMPHPLRGANLEDTAPNHVPIASVPSVPLGGVVPLGPIASVGQVPTVGMSSGPIGGVAIGNLTPVGSGAVRGVFPNRDMEGVLPMMMSSQVNAVGFPWLF